MKTGLAGVALNLSYLYMMEDKMPGMSYMYADCLVYLILTAGRPVGMEQAMAHGQPF